jgi:selenocysteine lyase/cysteine desulfurase
VVGGLGLNPGDEVITCSLEHSSVAVPFYYSRERFGVNAKIVPLSARDSDADILGRFEEAVTGAAKLVMLSHVTYGTGQLLPLGEICRLAHDRGAYVLVDAAQAIGQMPVDVRELDCDFYAFPGHKWLLGPAATGALYVRRDLIERLEPPKVAGRAAEHYDFQGEFRPKRDVIDKFELTTVSVALLSGLLAAIEFAQGIGLDVVRNRSLHLARYATERLPCVDGISLISASPPEAVTSGLVSFSLTNVAAELVTACLWDAVVAVAEGLARSGLPEGEMSSARLESQAMEDL